MGISFKQRTSRSCLRVLVNLRPSADWYLSWLYRTKYVARCSAWKSFIVEMATLRLHQNFNELPAMPPCTYNSTLQDFMMTVGHVINHTARLHSEELRLNQGNNNGRVVWQCGKVPDYPGVALPPDSRPNKARLPRGVIGIVVSADDVKRTGVALYLHLVDGSFVEWNGGVSKR